MSSVDVGDRLLPSGAGMADECNFRLRDGSEAKVKLQDGEETRNQVEGTQGLHSGPTPPDFKVCEEQTVERPKSRICIQNDLA